MEKGKYYISFIKTKTLPILIVLIFFAAKVHAQRGTPLASGSAVFSNYGIELNWTLGSPVAISGEVEGFIFNGNLGLQQLSISKSGIVQELQSDVLIYPNPFQNKFNINLDGNYTVKIYDQKGALIHQIQGMEEKSISIDATNWNFGLYFLHIHDGEKSISRKLIKTVL